MKKVLALFSSLLVFTGVKAQETTVIKKETVKPVLIKPSTADSLKTLKTGKTVKGTDKAIKFDQVKKTNTLPMKETIAKPGKY